jgi:probable HAF family extracellular repeat protein
MRSRLARMLRGALLAAAVLVPSSQRLVASPLGYTFTDLGPYNPPTDSSLGPRIDNSGQVALQARPVLDPSVGNGYDSSGDWQAYIVDGKGQKHFLGPFGTGGSFAMTVANGGSPSLLVGAVSPGFPAFYTPQAGWTRLPGLAANPGAANAVNADGQIVGTASPSSGLNSDGLRHAFLSQGGTTVDLNRLIPGSSSLTLTSATGINDQGQIVGIAAVGGNPSILHAFELTPNPSPLPDPSPVPEPSTLAFFGFASAAIASSRIRRLRLRWPVKKHSTGR